MGQARVSPCRIWLIRGRIKPKRIGSDRIGIGSGVKIEQRLWQHGSHQWCHDRNRVCAADKSGQRFGANARRADQNVAPHRLVGDAEAESTD